MRRWRLELTGRVAPASRERRFPALKKGRVPCGAPGGARAREGRSGDPGPLRARRSAPPFHLAREGGGRREGRSGGRRQNGLSRGAWVLLFPGAASTPAAAARAGLSEGSRSPGCETARSLGAGQRRRHVVRGHHEVQWLAEGPDWGGRGLQPTLRHPAPLALQEGYQLLDPYLTVSVWTRSAWAKLAPSRRPTSPRTMRKFWRQRHLTVVTWSWPSSTRRPSGYDHFAANCIRGTQELPARPAPRTPSRAASTWLHLGVHSAPFPVFIFYRTCLGPAFPSSPGSAAQGIPPLLVHVQVARGTGDATAVGVRGHSCASKKPSWVRFLLGMAAWPTGSREMGKGRSPLLPDFE